jgi:dolichyl-phosphate-mannose--protein O-mannosyl transferase
VRSVLMLAGALVVLPAVLYMAGYVQFFTMGHTLDQWRELQRQMWYYHSHLKATHPWSSRWWEWPLLRMPVWYYSDSNLGPDRAANIYALGNPVVFWAMLPAMAFVFTQWGERRYRDTALGLVLLGFFGQWLPWFLSPRISFLYHFLPCVPFGCLAIAYGLDRLRAPRVAAVGIAVTLVAFIYFYPLYAALPISRGYTDQHYWLANWRPH